MKFCLIGPGIMEIPPNGWGAVESLIWDIYNELQELGHDVEIINTPNTKDIINAVNSKNFDVVHLHYDVFIPILQHLRSPKKIISSHYPYVERKELHCLDGYDVVYKNLCNNENFFIGAVSKKDYDHLIQDVKDPQKCFLSRTGVSSTKYKYTKSPRLINRSICLGKKEPRKRQNLLEHDRSVDFIGKNCYDLYNKNYIGEISDEDKYNLLTEYANLALLSFGENGTPLVVKEALMCGLGIVVSEYCAHELDKTLPFITVIPETRINDRKFISEAISYNRQVSITMREEIRKYAISNFDWKILVKDYINRVSQL